MILNDIDNRIMLFLSFKRGITVKNKINGEWYLLFNKNVV
ncbi:hypothetical protein HMPREF3182_01401 [Megasphaera hutchinsoni]|uniref:Uncharacterized protein n=1 Tax=Megasphaera hutchinsoni TaxID=1588748 RepID=A0A134CCY0_9FIRM|nr:hypothetical protein HMPREF3182_01401 [Megasphaera hutchinsoni]